MVDLYGRYPLIVDDKRRICIPSRVRSELGASFYVTKKLGKPAIALYPIESWREFTGKLNALPNSTVQDIKLFLYPNTLNLSPDSQGRIGLSHELLDYAGIDTEKDPNCVLVGLGTSMLLYSAEGWKAHEAEEKAKEETLTEILCQVGL